MYLSVIIDVAALAVVVLFARLGYKRGLVRTLSELLIVILAMILAGKIADFASVRVIDQMRPAAHAAVEEQVDALLTKGDFYAAPEEITEKLLEMTEGLPDFLQEGVRYWVQNGPISAASVTHSAQETLTRLGTAAVDRALDQTVYRIVHGIAYTAAFTIVIFLLRLAMRAVFAVMKLPGLRQADQLGGLLIGLGKGVVLVWLAAWIVPIFVDIPLEVVEASFLLQRTRFVSQGPLMAKLFSLPGI